MISVAELIEHLRGWLGVPFHHQGRSRHGVDCIGLPIAVLAELGALPEGFQSPRNYGRRPTGHLVRGLARWCTPAPAAVPGTLIAITWPRQTEASHTAICTGPTIIHSHSSALGVVEHGYRDPWRRRTTSVWYLPGVAYE